MIRFTADLLFLLIAPGSGTVALDVEVCVEMEFRDCIN